ncbi:MAG: hypothetical protein ACREUG_02825 [Steroidobacteraceae bacterium]
MTPGDDRGERLERLTERMLHDLPLHLAPATLPDRVLQAIEQQARLPWWRRGITAWPLVARAVLLAGCCGSAACVLLGVSRLTTHGAAWPMAPALADRVEGVRAALASAASLSALAWRLIRAVPPHWLLGALLASALLYTLLFVLIAVGYRTLYLTSARPGMRPI